MPHLGFKRFLPRFEYSEVDEATFRRRPVRERFVTPPNFFDASQMRVGNSRCKQ